MSGIYLGIPAIANRSMSLTHRGTSTTLSDDVDDEVPCCEAQRFVWRGNPMEYRWYTSPGTERDVFTVVRCMRVRVRQRSESCEQEEERRQKVRKEDRLLRGIRREEGSTRFARVSNRVIAPFKSSERNPPMRRGKWNGIPKISSTENASETTIVRQSSITSCTCYIQD